VVASATGYLYYANSTTILYVNGRLVGEPIDSLNGVYVYYNGMTDNVLERHRTWDGYNLGLKFQCIEFVKRYYYERFDHKMPDAYGNAYTYINPRVKDGKLNRQRGLWQFTNASRWRPAVNDIIVFDTTATNPYGHIAIISKVKRHEIEIVQQNAGPVSPSRASYKLIRTDKGWYIDHPHVLGRLRMPKKR
jgi:hypothetical protein